MRIVFQVDIEMRLVFSDEVCFKEQRLGLSIGGDPVRCDGGAAS